MDLFLLDTNFFREATKSPGNQLLGRLIPQLRTRGFDFGMVDTAIRISPFGLLEALGIVPRMPPPRSFRVGRRDPKLVYKEIFDYALNHFRALPELQADHVRKKNAEQLSHLSPDGRQLFSECVSDVLDRAKGLPAIFAQFLSMDYFVKYPFSPADFEAMMPVLMPIFFMDLPEGSPTSRYRISVRFFNQIQRHLTAFPDHAEELEAHRLKNDRDLLDTDIIQEITYGFPFEGTRHRVVALTFDRAAVLHRRARHHRQVGISLSAKFQSDSEMAKLVHGFLAHPGGIVVEVAKTGDIVELLDLAPVFSALP